MTADERIPDGSGGDGHRTEVVRLEWTAFGEPTSGVVEAVSRAASEPPTALPPLHDAIETDALNVLLTDGARTQETPFTVTFSYANYRITVSADGDVVVERPA